MTTTRHLVDPDLADALDQLPSVPLSAEALPQMRAALSEMAEQATAAARAESLAGLPPTYMSVGSLDLFLEEDLEYARRLIRAGVPTELHVYSGAYHGYPLVPNAWMSRAEERNSQDALRRALWPRSSAPL